ncbi:unnamed protein product, partial [Rotaria sp. Silwood2]
ILSDVMMTISLLRTSEFDPNAQTECTLMLGVLALRRIAGVNVFNYNQLKSINENKSILQTNIELAQHQIIRARILNLLNNLVTNCNINMTVNISAFSSITSTYGRVHLIAPGHDVLCRS